MALSNNIIRDSTLYFSIILLLIFGFIFPFLWASYYTHPCADDYSYVLKALNNDIWASQWYWYNNWSGRYTATALISFSPLYFQNYLGYKIAPMCWLVLTIASFYWLIKEFFHSVCQKMAFLYTIILSCLYFAFIPEPTEGIYWYAGASTYQFSNVMLMLTLTGLFKSYRLKGTFSRSCFLLVLLASLILAGLNETIMTIQTFFAAALVGIRLHFRQKWDKRLFILFTVSLSGALVVYLAPGNDVRISNFPTSQKLWAFVEALIYSGFLFWKFLLSTPAWIVAIIYTLYYLDKSIPITNHKIYQIHPGISWVTFFALMYTGTFVGFWSLGFRPPLRTHNVLYMLFILGFFFNIHHTIVYWKKFLTKISIPRYTYFVLYLLLAIYLLSPTNQSLLVYQQLAMGKLQRFDHQMKQRYEHIALDTSAHVVLPIIPEAQDNIVYYLDIQTDSAHWSNKNYASYYDKQTIRLNEHPSAKQ